LALGGFRRHGTTLLQSSFNEGHDAKGAHEGGHGAEGHEEGEGKGGGGCFSGASSVYAKGRGPIKIKDLRVGDQILAGEASTGALFFSPFIAHLHLEVATHAKFLVVKAEGTQSVLHVSQEHLVFAARAGATGASMEPLLARDLRAGDQLNRVGCDGELYQVEIASITTASLEGLYAPLTQSGTVVVDGFLCSCYADAFPTAGVLPWLQRLTSSHAVVHGALLPLRLSRSLLGLSDGSGQGEANPPEGIHPYCRALMAIPLAARAVATA